MDNNTDGVTPDQLSSQGCAALCNRTLDDLRGQVEGVCSLTPEQTARLEDYFRLLLDWNRHINLTGASDLTTLVREHLPDSLVLAATLADGAALVDVGSGGGLPALPLAVMRPDLSITLVEPRAKRVAFLRTAVRHLGLSRVQIHPIRLEQMDPALFGSFAAAVSRATFSPEEWLHHAVPLVRPGGQIYVLRSPGGDEPGAVGLVQTHAVDYVLATGQPRQLLVFRRST